MQTNEHKTGCAESILLIIGYLTLPVLYCFWGGYAACRVWEWLIAPNLPVPQLSIAAASGAALILSLLRAKIPKSDKKEKEPWADFGNTLAISILTPAMALFCAWIVKSFT